MEKEVHVNSYYKKDGTHVREHIRHIDGSTSFMPENKTPEYVWDEQNRDILKEILPDIYKNIPTVMNATPVLKGGVSKGGVNWEDILGSMGDVLTTALGAGVQIIPMALQLYQAMNSGNGQSVEYLKPQFDTKIKQLDTQVKQMKQNIDTSIAKLNEVKTQKEYEEIYKPLSKDWQAYQQAAHLLNQIKNHANNGEYESVANKLGNYVNYEKSNKLPNMTQKNMTNLKTFTSNISEDLKYSSGILNIVNSALNRNRPDAKQLMNLSLNFPKNNYSTDEYTIIQPIFNSKLNEMLKNKGTTLKVSKNTKGIVFDKSSSISQKLSNFEQLQNDIREKYNKDTKYIGGLGIDKDKNLQYAIGHYTILNPHIENGYFKGMLFDIYDFDWMTSKNLDDINVVVINNIAYLLQLLHKIKNFYFLIPIKFKW